MAGNRRRGQLISLAQRRKRRVQEALVQAKGQMIEAEHALFVALRLAGHANAMPGNATGWRKPPARAARAQPRVASVVPLLPRGKRAA
jgi:hypothetical protein